MTGNLIFWILCQPWHEHHVQKQQMYLWKNIDYPLILRVWSRTLIVIREGREKNENETCAGEFNRVHHRGTWVVMMTFISTTNVHWTVLLSESEIKSHLIILWTAWQYVIVTVFFVSSTTCVSYRLSFSVVIFPAMLPLIANILNFSLRLRYVWHFNLNF